MERHLFPFQLEFGYNKISGASSICRSSSRVAERSLTYKNKKNKNASLMCNVDEHRLWQCIYFRVSLSWIEPNISSLEHLPIVVACHGEVAHLQKRTNTLRPSRTLPFQSRLAHPLPLNLVSHTAQRETGERMTWYAYI